MLKNIAIRNVLFLDIETVPIAENFFDLSSDFQELWQEKNRGKISEDLSAEDLWNSDGALFAEFSKIVCVSVGILRGSDDELILRKKSFASEDEKQLLEDFAKLLNESYSYPNAVLCAHNGKSFDFPFLARRMLILGIELPQALDIAGKKPWEIPHIDTMELWRFSDFRYTVSLKLLCKIFGIPSPKDDMTGKDVAKLFYKDKDIKKIADYCEKDVEALVKVFLKLSGKEVCNIINS